MRGLTLTSVLFATAVFALAVPAHATVLDSQLDDSAQSVRPPVNDLLYTGNGFYLAAGYVPQSNFSFSGVRFRVNQSSGGDYVCPVGSVLQYNATSTPTLWSDGFSVGSIIPATTTPDANGNCDYMTANNYGQIESIPVSTQRYYVFFMAVGGNYTKWVSMSGKPIATSTDQSFFGFRPSGHNTYYWGNTGLSSVYLELFDTPPPFVTTPPDPCVATNSCASNVLFLPGIESSRLYRPDYNGGTDRLWEPIANSDVQDLYMNPDGTSIRFDVYAKERDVIDELPGGKNIYKSFISKMDDLKVSGTINDWEPIAYDWRLSLDDILNYGNDVEGRIYYSGDLRATSTPYIIQQLKYLAATSKTGKVTIIAHSNGGLLAKRLTQILGATEAARLIDKMIFVAVPQAGTPMAIPAGLHGYEQQHLNGLVTSKSTARTFAVNAPMEYQLLPSAQYFTQVDDPVISFDATLPDWITRYGPTIHSQETLHTFLTDTYGRVDPQTGDIEQPIQMNNSLLTNAETLHTSLDTWTPPTGTSLIQIAGWGVPKTVAGISYKQKGTGVTSEPSLTVDGDGTVVVPSALWTSTTAGAQNYWLDLKRYSNDHWVNTVGGFRPFNHANILETDSILGFIEDNISNVINPLSSYIYLSTQAPAATESRLRYALHSPLTLNLYDDQGRHTGISTTTWEVEEQIPGTYYAEFGDVKYLFSDASSTARVVMDGYALGTFTFNVDQYSGNTLTASTTFKDIPTTPDTVVVMDIQSDISTLSPMSVDKDGDGVVDITIAPKLGDIATVDTTPPELQITYSTSTQSIIIVGKDDMGSTTVSSSTIYPVLSRKQKSGIATTTVIVRDTSDNVTSLIYTKPFPQATQSDAVTLRTIAYNGVTTTIPLTKLSYKWSIRKGEYQSFASSLTTSLESLTSTYNSRKNTTTIMPANQILPGMVIPYMETDKGKSIINY